MENNRKKKIKHFWKKRTIAKYPEQKNTRTISNKIMIVCTHDKYMCL